MKVFYVLGVVLILLSYPVHLFSAGTTLTITILGDTQCIDGIDNDSDGLIDYTDDPGCSSYADDDETDSVDDGGGGGGGGGGSYIITPINSVIFTGIAFPNSDITLLKNAQVVAVTKAGPDAKFEIRLSTGISAGTYTFGVWGEDTKGRRSVALTFTITLTSGVTTVVSGIFLPPTIDVDKAEVRRGDILTILGQSAPDAEITVFINSGHEILKKITTDNDGLWVYKFDTIEIEYGDHTTRSRSLKDDDITIFSSVIPFIVGTKNVFATTKQYCPAKADLNNDCRVNLVDFSIAAFWYKRPISPEFAIREAEHLTDDGKVDLIDFSIMAFYWTG